MADPTGGKEKKRGTRGALTTLGRIWRLGLAGLEAHWDGVNTGERGSGSSVRQEEDRGERGRLQTMQGKQWRAQEVE